MTRAHLSTYVSGVTRRTINAGSTSGSLAAFVTLLTATVLILGMAAERDLLTLDRAFSLLQLLRILLSC